MDTHHPDMADAMRKEAEQREAAAIAADLAYMQGREAREWRMQERALEDQQRLLAAQGML